MRVCMKDTLNSCQSRIRQRFLQRKTSTFVKRNIENKIYFEALDSEEPLNTNGKIAQENILIKGGGLSHII